MVLSRKWSGTTFTILTITTFHSFETSYSTFISFPCSLSSMYCLNDTCWVFTLEFYRILYSSCFIVTFFILGSHLFYSVVTKSSSSPLFVSQIKYKIGNILTKTTALRVNLDLDGTPITSRTHTDPSHSQTTRLLTSSLSLVVPVTRASSLDVKTDLLTFFFSLHILLW